MLSKHLENFDWIHVTTFEHQGLGVWALAPNLWICEKKFALLDEAILTLVTSRKCFSERKFKDKKFNRRSKKLITKQCLVHKV
jgi:hypothetical protein